MARYRKLPVIVEAVQVTPQMRSEGGPFPEWARPHLKLSRRDGIHEGVTLTVATLEGEMTVSDGDWLIHGVKGEVYPCKPDVFSATYEPVEEREE